MWHYKKLKPNEIKFAPCLDNHPGYPKEYLECGFPVDWWLEKSFEIDKDFEIKRIIQSETVDIDKKKWIVKKPTITINNISNNK